MHTDFTIARPGPATHGPLGVPVTPSALAEYLGGVDASAATGLLSRVAGAATQIAEDTLGYSFRERSFTARIPGGNRNVSIWLPWGPARAVTVTPATLTLTTEPSPHNPLVTYACVDSADAFSLSWTVGQPSGWPDDVVLGLLRLSATLWHDRGADGAKNLRPDVLATLGQYRAGSDWL